MASKLSALGIAAAAILAGCTEEKAEAEPVEVEELVVAQEDERIKLDIKVPQVEGLEAFNEQAMRLGEQLEEQTRQSEQAVEEGYTDLHAEGKNEFRDKVPGCPNHQRIDDRFFVRSRGGEWLYV